MKVSGHRSRRVLALLIGVGTLSLIGFQNCSGVNSSPTGTNSGASVVVPPPSPDPVAQLAVASGNIPEGKQASVQVAISAARSATITLLWDLTKSDGSSAVADFMDVSGYVDVPANANQVAITLTSLNDNTFEIPDKKFNLRVRDSNGTYTAVVGVITVNGEAFLGSVTTAGTFSCGSSDQVIKCWGSNGSGQLGNASTTGSTSPVAVAGLPAGASIKQVANGQSGFACALLSTGAVYCWGNNASGQLGLGAAGNRTSATAVPLLTTGVSSISLGISHACAIKDSALYCWGLNANGQLGTGDANNRTAPVLITAAGPVSAVSAGTNFTCVVNNGAAKCFGLGTSGQLGNASLASSLVPVGVVGAESGVVSIAAGTTHACALLGDAVKCWGTNGNGQLGDGTVVNKSVATPVSTLGAGSGVSYISAGQNYTCAIVKTVPYCWGANNNDQSGTPVVASRTAPAIASAVIGSGFLRISAAADGQHTCAMKPPKAIHCWGVGTNGQLGGGSAPTNAAPNATPINF